MIMVENFCVGSWCNLRKNSCVTVHMHWESLRIIFLFSFCTISDHILHLSNGLSQNQWWKLKNKAAALSVSGTNNKINYSVSKNTLVIFKKALSKKLMGSREVQPKFLRNLKSEISAFFPAMCDRSHQPIFASQRAKNWKMWHLSLWTAPGASLEAQSSGCVLCSGQIVQSFNKWLNL